MNIERIEKLLALTEKISIQSDFNKKLKNDFKNKFFPDFKCTLDEFIVFIPIKLENDLQHLKDLDWAFFTEYTEEIIATRKNWTPTDFIKY